MKKLLAVTAIVSVFVYAKRRKIGAFIRESTDTINN